MQRKTKAAFALSGVMTAGAISAGGAGLLSATSCQQNPTPTAVRTFERAQKVDVICLKVLAPSAADPKLLVSIPPEPAPSQACAPVSANTNGAALPFHLYALVTQTTRGELAVVDLTESVIVDEDIGTPGINFVPVGALPTDIAATPDGKMAFVTSAESNKAAIYGIPASRLLGNSRKLPPEQTLPPPRVTQWPACSLPQVPVAVTIVPHLPSATAPVDAPKEDPAYDIVVVLQAGPGTQATSVDADAGAAPAPLSAKVMRLDPRPFLRASAYTTDEGGVQAPPMTPGELPPCALYQISATELSAEFEKSFEPGPAWGTGVPYATVGAVPLPKPFASGETCAVTDGTSPGSRTIRVEAGELPAAAAATREGQFLYVADQNLPIVHVFDLSAPIPAAPRELPPFRATSLAEPERKITVGAIAVSPITRDFQRFMYAADRGTGGIMVFDVSDPATAPRVPLTRPNPELNPFQPADRIQFVSPVATVGFVKHDFALVTDIFGSPRTTALSGLQCNPNLLAGDPNPVAEQRRPRDEGVLYAANSAFGGPDKPFLGPSRLRGIFGFATLANGQMVTIDVDDWDAPCRRPELLTSKWLTNDLARPQIGGGVDDIGPYQTPWARGSQAGSQTSTPVTMEAFYPVIAPHRPRSAYPLVSDPSAGNHAPYLSSVPALYAEKSVLSAGGTTGATFPLLLPTQSSLDDPTYMRRPTVPSPAGTDGEPVPDRTVKPGDKSIVLPSSGAPGVRFAWETPLVHFPQDWTVTYEGILPGAEGTRVTLETTDLYRSMELKNDGALFCRLGVEDFRLGQARALAAIDEAKSRKLAMPIGLERAVTDYVQITSEIPPPSDPYWDLVEPKDGSACFPEGSSRQQRYDRCLMAFGNARDQSLERDFPILEAYENRLVIGRYGVPAGAPQLATSSREVVGPDDSNKPFLKDLRCCFARQATFRVRTGSEWVAESTAVGFLHHVRASGPQRACVQSCDPIDSLKNARSLEVLRPADESLVVPPDRNSVLAMRNPMHAYVIWAGAPGTAPDRTTTKRDSAWAFSTRGEFTPFYANLAQDGPVNPQSMRFIDSLSQLAVVDSVSQGLFLFNLRTFPSRKIFF